MKTLIINGSPRKNGDTVYLINELKSLLNGEVQVINTYFSNVSPCNDCRYCWRNDQCSINDEMQEVINNINEADNIVIASPVYFSELTGSLLNFASRLQFLYVSKFFRKKAVLQEKLRNGFVVLVGGGDGSTNKALSTAKCLLSLMEATYIDSVISHNTNNLPACDDEYAIVKIRTVAERINEM